MTNEEKAALPRLDYSPPAFRDTGTQPFNDGQRVWKYRFEDLKKEGEPDERPNWLARHILDIWTQTGRAVPYAFQARDGTIRSLDAGCISRLLKAQPPRLEIADVDEQGFITAVRPTAFLLGEIGEIAVGDIELPFDIDAPVDERRRNESERVIREGARAFKAALLGVWGGSCAITGTAVPEVLDAAHIYPYLGPRTNHIANGILLRADVHRLFDAQLLSLRYQGDQLAIVCSAEIRGSEYARYRYVGLPQHAEFRPDAGLIEHRYQLFVSRSAR